MNNLEQKANELTKDRDKIEAPYEKHANELLKSCALAPFTLAFDIALKLTPIYGDVYIHRMQNDHIKEEKRYGRNVRLRARLQQATFYAAKYASYFYLLSELLSN